MEVLVGLRYGWMVCRDFTGFHDKILLKQLAAALRIGEARGLDGEGLQQNASTKCHLTGVCTKSHLTE